MKQKNNIHIVYIITKLELGGAQKVCLELFNGLQKADISSHLITGAHGTLINTIKENNHVIMLDQFKREISFSNLLNELHCLWQLIIQLRSLKKKEQTILVHTHSTKAGIIGRWAAWFAGISIRIHTIHGYGFHNHQPWIPWLTFYVLELITSLITTHYICVSSTDINTGKKLFPFFTYKHSLIRAAVNQQQFYTPAYVTSINTTEVHQNIPFIFGTIACFKPQKNLFDLLNAFTLTHQKNPNTRLEIIGDGIQRTIIEQWIIKHNLIHAIVLHGWQPDVAPIMLHWNAFVLSSLWEGLPCAIVEARLLKLPVVCYDTGGIKDIIIHNKNGLLYKQKDWHALSHGMISLTHNKTLYKQLRNYKDNLQDFSNMHMINTHITLYKKLASIIK